MFWLTNVYGRAIRLPHGLRQNQAEGGEGSGGGSGQSGTGAGGGQGAGAGQSGTGAQNSGAGAGSGAGASGQESGRQQNFSADYVKDLRNSEAGYRTRATTAEEKLKTAETERDQLRASLRARDVLAEVGTHAPDLKIASANAAFKLLDQSKLKFDDAGKPTNVKELLEELIKTETFLVTPAVSTSATNPARDGAKFTLEQIKKMTPEEINANWAEVQKVMAAEG